MMRLMVFPAAFMANTFAMMVVMIGLSLFGKAALAADFGLIHGATVALFFSFSGNARSLILGESKDVSAAEILRIRFLMVLPLSALALMLCIGLVDESLIFILLLVARRAAEWLAEIFLSEQELRHRSSAAIRCVVIQGALSALVLVALVEESLTLPALLFWALSPLLGCASLNLIRRSVDVEAKLLKSLQLLLPHFGSTAVIGASVYVFRLFILLVAGKELAGDLFAAFALGGILGAVFAQALGPTMVRQEQRAVQAGRMHQAFNLMQLGTVMLGISLVLSVWFFPSILKFSFKSDLFWLAVGCSLLGGVVMVQAQRIRLRIIQDRSGGDVFGSDMLSNILLVSSIPFLFYGISVNSLVGLYLLGAVLSLAFYASERNGLLRTRAFSWLSERVVLQVLAIAIFTPLFFQLSGGVYTEKEINFSSGGVLALLPVPLSVLVCYFGILLLGKYSQARLVLLALFFIFIGMLLTSLVVGDMQGQQGRTKLVLLIQYVLPMFALVLGQQYGAKESALPSLAMAGICVLSVLVPLQLLSSFLGGGRLLSPDVFVFSIYQHLQYVPVIFVGIFWISIFVTFADHRYRHWMALLGFLMGIYVVLSFSMLAILFMVGGGLGLFGLMLARKRILGSLHVLVPAIIGSALGYFYVEGSAFFAHKFSLLGEVGPASAAERWFYWNYYLDRIMADWRTLFLGHVAPPSRELYPSAHNYYLDFVYNFGLIGAASILVLLAYTAVAVLRNFALIWGRVDLLGLVGVAAFLLVVDNSLKVSLRQPYPGIFMFFIWGVVLAQLSDLRLQKKSIELSL